MIYLSNAFSLSMFPAGQGMLFKMVPVTVEEVAGKDFISVVGHPDTANILTGMLGKNVVCNRISLALNYNDVLYVAQYYGPRLAEGATKLPEGAKIDFVRITHHSTSTIPCPGQDCNNCAITMFSCCDRLDIMTSQRSI